MYWYILGAKGKGLVFNSYKELVVGCYANADFGGLWRHKNHKDFIFNRSRTGLVLTSDNCPLLRVTKL